MRLVIYVTGIVLTVWVSLLAFLPGKELYMTAERFLSENKIAVNERTLRDRFGGFEADTLEFFYDGIALAKAERLGCRFGLVYNICEISALHIDDTFASSFPETIETVRIRYGVFDPTHILIDMIGDFGDVHGTVGFEKKGMRIDIDDVSALRGLRRYLKKDGKGWYYEIAF
jgi:hypothetical protein